MMSIQRSEARYRPGAALLAGVTGLAAILGVMASPGGASPRPDPSPGAEPRRVGMNSCAARGCHGAVDATDPSKGLVYIKDGSYTTWLNYDPHAQAYQVLLESRSTEIAKKLNANTLNSPLGGKPAHEAALCLSCHATVDPPPAKSPEVAMFRDGITCEACHGPAEAWQDKHLVASWRGLPAEAKAKDGMTDLSTPSARAKMCVECHVGNPSRGMDMNHDLIAAGHPRLDFEFATYQAAYPKHWKEKHGADFEAKSLPIGQLVTLRAVLELLADRALASKVGVKRVEPAPEAIWPEFSEYECFACHHGLTNPSPLQNKDHIEARAGHLPWATWPTAILPDLVGGPAVLGEDLSKLKSEMEKIAPDPNTVAALANSSILVIDKLVEAMEAKPFNGAGVAALLKELTSRPKAMDEGWDRAAQHCLALLSLARASKDLGVPIGPVAEAAIRESSKVLEFPPNYDSPRNVSAVQAPKPKAPPKPK